MPISDLLLQEYDEEVKRSRAILERVPMDKGSFAPHAKSMPLERLAPHLAQLGGFGLEILTTPELDFAQRSFTRVPFESNAQLVRVLDEGAAKVRAALKATPDSAWTQPWKLSAAGKPIFTGFSIPRLPTMFLNHIVHHRAQLGVYLRLNNVPVPATYGPSADDAIGL